jgi:hypothetical protein
VVSGNSISSVSASDDGTDITVTFTTSIDLSGGWIGFGYGVNALPYDTRSIPGAVSSQSIVVSLADLGATLGDTIYIDAMYSLEDPPVDWVYATDEGSSLTEYVVGGGSLVNVAANSVALTITAHSASVTLDNLFVNVDASTATFTLTSHTATIGVVETLSTVNVNLASLTLLTHPALIKLQSGTAVSNGVWMRRRRRA